MNQTIKDSLNATFGVESTPSSVSTVTQPTQAIVKPKKSKSLQVSPVGQTKVLSAFAIKERNEQERRGDLKTSRTAIEKVLQTGTDAIDNLYSLAVDSEEPRTYEVLADMIDKIGNAAEKLMKLRREEAEINRIEAKIELDKNAGQDNGPKSVTTNNTIFVGDAKELLKHIKGAQSPVTVKVEEVK